MRGEPLWSHFFGCQLHVGRNRGALRPALITLASVLTKYLLDVPQQTALLDVRPTPSQAEVCSEEAADSNGSPKPKPIPGVASLGQLPREPVDLPPLSVLPKSLPPKPVLPSDPMGGHECILLPSPPPQPSPSQRKPSLLERRRQPLGCQQGEEAAYRGSGRHRSRTIRRRPTPRRCALRASSPSLPTLSRRLPRELARAATELGA